MTPIAVCVRDDGLGGADPDRGSGLVGLRDRAEAIGGTLSLVSAPGAGTSLSVELPLEDVRRGGGSDVIFARAGETY